MAQLMLTLNSRIRLIQVAFAAIDNGLRLGSLDRTIDLHREPEEVRVPQGSFVTIHLKGQLRGCIGSIHPRQPLIMDVAENAYGAAFRDLRFSPLRASERAKITVGISTLSPLIPLPFKSERELHAILRAGVDGLVLSYKSASATFLPSVWESLPDPPDFVRELRRKAGIPDWIPTEQLEATRYTTCSFDSSVIRS